jgi:hypothetical protein
MFPDFETYYSTFICDSQGLSGRYLQVPTLRHVFPSEKANFSLLLDMNLES